MGLSVSTTIFLFIVCLCGGIVIGALFSRIKKTPGPSTPVQEVVREVKKEEPAPEPFPVLAPVPVQKSLAREGDLEILRAWRNDTGKVWLEMDATRFDGKDGMSPEQRRKLVNLVIELRPWLDASQIPAPMPRVQPTPQPVRPASRPSLFAPIAIKTEKPAEAEKPKVNLKSIVEQIDDVLQAKLPATIYKDQDIHLLDAPGGAVLVQIDDEKFDGIDAVSDPEIKRLIRQAISDWEKGSS